MDVKYESGTLKVIAFDKSANPVGEKEIHTAGKPHHLQLFADKCEIKTDGKIFRL